MPWTQIYLPVADSPAVSALIAAIPLAVIFVCLALFKMKAHRAGLLALASALGIAITVWDMPAGLAGLAALQGAAFGFFPVSCIVAATILLYNITVQSGHFEVLRASLAGLTTDRRLQALLIAFCFGAFIEGSAGFGTPVAIAGATLVGLGFRPFYAAGVCLIANTAPVAFGAIGIPLVSLAGVMGYDDAGLMKLSTMVGRQLPFISMFIPGYIVFIMSGWRGTREVLPAVFVCCATFALFQWAAASYLGPYLPDIIASLASIVALVALLRFWRPKSVWTFEHDSQSGAEERHEYSAREIALAWAPYLALTLLVLVWGLPVVKGMLDRMTLGIAVPLLHNGILKTVGGALIPIPAVFRLNLLSAPATAILIASVISAGICGIGFSGFFRAVGKTLHDLRFPFLTISAVLALAYVMNAAGMTAALGLVFTRTGMLFPFLAPFLGWLGVFLTGSDTSSNVLFGGMQKIAAEQLGIDPLLTGAANSSGGVMGKMISPQSIAVATAATGLVGEEGNLFLFTLRHSLFLTTLIGALVFLQAYVFPCMIP
ncbi:MAG TPA: L-lactate permease [Geobacteraceae bacterium]|nr:L-lactate permease [Geobacteraceae bacterium]